jgi:hypothetical protein
MARRASPRRSAAVFTAAWMACAAMSLPAVGQTDVDRAGARAAASEGLKAFDAGRWAEALDLFTRAESLVHAPPHLLYIARAHQQLGHLVEAHEVYMRIKNENISPDKPQAFQDAHANAVAELAVLEPTIPNVKIVVGGAPQGSVSVLVDGSPMNAALIGIPHPIDPGPHTFQATAQGLGSSPVSVTVQKAGNVTVTLDLKPTGDTRPAAVPPAAPVSAVPVPLPATVPPASSTPAPASVPPAPVSPAAALSPPPPSESHAFEPGPEPARDETHRTNSLRTAAVPVFGVAAVGVGLGVAFFIVSRSKESDASSLCTLPAGVCPIHTQSQVVSLDNSAKGARSISVASFVVGGTALVSGIVLLAAGGSASGGAEHTRGGQPTVSPWVGWGSAGLQGVF